MAESTSREVYFLKQVSTQKYNKDFAVNMIQVNNTLTSIAKYLIVMQKGIDDLNRDIIEQIRDFIQELIIMFNGGDFSELGLDWGDLKYVFQAIGSFFGLGNWFGSGDIWSPLQMVQNFFENFFKPFDFFKDAIGNIFDQAILFILNLLSWIPGVGSIREKFAASINNARQQGITAQQETAQIGEVLKGNPITAISQGVQDFKDWFGGLVSWQGNKDAQVSANTAAINDLSSDMQALGVTQLWASLSSNDIVSFPRILLGLDISERTGNYTVSGTTGSGGASGGSHTHSFNDGSHSHTMVHTMGTISPGKGSIAYVPMIVDRFCRPRYFKLITGSAGWSFFSIDFWKIALCVYNPNTGNVEKVWDGGDRKSELSSARKLYAWDMGTLGNVSPGTILFGCQVQNAGLVVNTRPIGGLWQPDLDDPSSGLLQSQFYRLSGNDIPSSVALSSLTIDRDSIPWMGVGVEPIS